MLFGELDLFTTCVTSDCNFLPQTIERQRDNRFFKKIVSRTSNFLNIKATDVQNGFPLVTRISQSRDDEPISFF